MNSIWGKHCITLPNIWGNEIQLSSKLSKLDVRKDYLTDHKLKEDNSNQ
jgi:hypothetical protein